MNRVLITGSSGRIGTLLSRSLQGRGFPLRLLDRVASDLPSSAADSELETVVADITDIDALDHAMRDVSCVIHLAGIPEEAEFEPLLEANIRGTYNVFESARRSGAKRVVFASTNHVIGFYPSDRTVTAVDPLRPDTLYAASKIYGEALGCLYHDKHRMEVIAVRIGSFRPAPTAHRELTTWLSYDDAVRLFVACVEAPAVGYEVVYGVSANPGVKWVGDSSNTIGYHPKDSADSVNAGDLQISPSDRFHGGAYTEPTHQGGF